METLLPPRRLPAGVTVVRWEPRPGPFRVVGVGTVENTNAYLAEKFGQLRAILRGDQSWATTGNWPAETLLSQLHEAGIAVQLDEAIQRRLRRRANLQARRARRRRSVAR